MTQGVSASVTAWVDLNKPDYLDVDQTAAGVGPVSAAAGCGTMQQARAGCEVRNADGGPEGPPKDLRSGRRAYSPPPSPCT